MIDSWLFAEMRSEPGTETRGKLRLWRLPALDELELIHGVKMNHDYPPHIHREYSVLLVLHGVEAHLGRNRCYQAYPGEVALVDPDEVHASRSINAEYKIFRIGRKTLTQIGTEAVGRRFNARFDTDPVVQDPACFRLLLDLHLRLGKKASALEQESEFVSAIGRLLSGRQSATGAARVATKERRQILRVQEYLRAHFAENTSLEQLAAITGLSSFYLLRGFREQVGFPPHEFQTQVRIAQARKLIRNGKPILQTALETGFFDQSHLSRNFKRVVGMTPGQYSAQSNIVQDAAS